MDVTYDSHLKLYRANLFAKELESELYHARASWSVFEAGNGVDEGDRAKLHELVNETHANHTFQHIIRSAATMTVLSIARLSDVPKRQRYTIGGLKDAVEQSTDLLIESAGNWFPEIEGRPERDRLWVSDEIQTLIGLIDYFLGSPEIERLRALRNEALAHRLSIYTSRPTFNDIGWAFKKIHEIVSKASVVVTGTNWDPDDFYKAQLTYANEFWDHFERGLADP